MNIKASFRTFFYLCFFIISCSAAFAQPTSDGGLNIMYVTSGETPNTATLKKEDFDINYYYKLQSKLKNRFMTYNPMQITSYHFVNQRGLIYLPGYIKVPKKGTIQVPDQRVEIIYKMDTMTVDFEDIRLYGIGYTDVMDTLHFYPGKHFRIKLEPLKVSPKCLQRYQYYSPPPLELWGSELLLKARQLLREGITDRTKSFLQQYELLSIVN